MRVLVCGGRNFAHREFLYDFLDKFHAQKPITTLIHGAAPGADSMANLWAKRRGVEVEAYPAKWEHLDLSAGHARNERMLVQGKPQIVIAFPGGKGTTNMVLQSREAGVPVVRIRSDLSVATLKPKEKTN